MALTHQQLADFHAFAVTKLESGSAETLQDLIDEWTAAREHEQSVAAIRESVAQYEAGQGMSVKQAFDEIRAKLGLSK